MKAAQWRSIPPDFTRLAFRVPEFSQTLLHFFCPGVGSFNVAPGASTGVGRKTTPNSTMASLARVGAATWRAVLLPGQIPPWLAVLLSARESLPAAAIPFSASLSSSTLGHNSEFETAPRAVLQKQQVAGFQVAVRGSPPTGSCPKPLYRRPSGSSAVKWTFFDGITGLSRLRPPATVRFRRNARPLRSRAHSRLKLRRPGLHPRFIPTLTFLHRTDARSAKRSLIICRNSPRLIIRDRSHHRQRALESGQADDFRRADVRAVANALGAGTQRADRVFPPASSHSPTAQSPCIGVPGACGAGSGAALNLRTPPNPPVSSCFIQLPSTRLPHWPRGQVLSVATRGGKHGSAIDGPMGASQSRVCALW